MMALAKSISHTKESLGYGWNLEKDALVAFKSNLIGDTVSQVLEEFKLIQNQNYHCRNNTISVVLSLSSNNKVSVDKKVWGAMISEYLDEMNLSSHQAIAFQHKDKPHSHCHLYINRIDFNGKAYNDYRIGKRSGEVADSISKKYGLQRPKEIKRLRLENSKAARGDIYKAHMYTLSNLKERSYSMYIKRMFEYGIKVNTIVSKNGHLNGFRYHYKNQSYKASEVHRSMSFKNLHQALYPELEHTPSLTEARAEFRELATNNHNLQITIAVFDGLLGVLRQSTYSENEEQDKINNRKKKKKKSRGFRI